MSSIIITPLRKRKGLGDKLYTRTTENESLLVELSSLLRDDLIERAAISNRAHSGYVPSECLVYFIRASRNDNREDWFERLFRILAKRILRKRLTRVERRDGKSNSLMEETISSAVFERFVDLLCADRETYDERLDFFEVHFDQALANLRRDARRVVQRAVRQDKKQLRSLYKEGSSELSAEVEAAAGTYNPFTEPEFGDADYRSRLDAAIDMLPHECSRVIHMLAQGFPIDSKNPDAVTIATTLGLSEKTVRNRRDKAFAALRALMNNGEAL